MSRHGRHQFLWTYSQTYVNINMLTLRSDIWSKELEPTRFSHIFFSIIVCETNRVVRGGSQLKGVSLENGKGHHVGKNLIIPHDVVTFPLNFSSVLVLKWGKVQERKCILFIMRTSPLNISFYFFLLVRFW